MRENKILNYTLFLSLSLLMTISFVGIDNIWFSKTDWLLGSGDLTNAQLSWQFFQNDLWRFPIGKNPNYGLEVSNSIIFTDNIPLLAIIFKILNPLISNKFQYFSLWIFLCLFLQALFSYKLIMKITNNIQFSFISSFLFILCPFLLFRLSHHFSLGAHWLILYGFYIAYFIEEKKKDLHWYILIFLSLVIHLYFTLIIFIIYFFFILERSIKNKNIKIEIKKLIFKLLFSFLIMFVLGYFESHPINAVSTGYGLKKIDILSFFDPQLDGQQSWSFFLKDLPGTHLEGFSYLGLGNILLIFFSSLICLKNIYNKKKNDVNFKVIRFSNIFLFLFLIWALSTNISIMGYEIISITLPKYIFGILSIFSSTGRFAWPVIYFILFVSLLLIYKTFPKKVSLLIILSMLVIQFLDIGKGFYNNKLKENSQFSKIYNDEIWNVIEKDYQMIRTTYLFNNYGPIFNNLSKVLVNLENIKTDIILNAAMDRKIAAKVRYNLIENIDNKKLLQNTAYIVDNLGHLKQLKKVFYNEDHGFFFRDNFWIILPNKKNLMNENDLIKIKNIQTDQIEIDKKYNMKFKGNFLGFGWSHNFGNEGTWSEGKKSFILFKKPPSKKDLEIQFFFTPYKSNKNKDYSFKVFLNDEFIKAVNIQKQDNFKINLKKNLEDKEILIRFEFDNLISPFDLLESPDARLLGILLKSFTVKEL